MEFIWRNLEFSMFVILRFIQKLILVKKCCANMQLNHPSQNTLLNLLVFLLVCMNRLKIDGFGIRYWALVNLLALKHIIVM